ncbi:MAG: hypothetical protein D6677_14140 [Calditrichaeota bacterium]|nr:MAG: hypothetical protein D6677_14140 [Calditrichota bacterium]
MRALLISALTLFLLTAACQSPHIEQEFAAGLEKIRGQYAPDASLALCNAEVRKNGRGWSLVGETTVPRAAAALRALADSLLHNTYTDSLSVLPAASLGDSNWAIVRVSVAHLRRASRHSSELIDQAIMGRVLRLLKKDGGWYLTQTPYGYIGWVNGKSLTRSDSAGVARWQQASLLRVNSFDALIYSQPDNTSLPVSDAVFNMRVRKVKSRGAWTKVALPDGRTGYIASSAVKPAHIYPRAGGRSITQTARRMLGVPYLWGGNSNKGNDCSGFTQNVFLAHGIQLPRDARQQALKGQPVDPGADFSRLRPGDLLFFGKPGKITHVGISLGGPRFIHQAGDVHINSFDPADSLYNPARRKAFQFARRILKDDQ